MSVRQQDYFQSNERICMKLLPELCIVSKQGTLHQMLGMIPD